MAMLYWAFGWIRWYLSFFGHKSRIYLPRADQTRLAGKSHIYRLMQGFPAYMNWIGVILFLDRTAEISWIIMNLAQGFEPFQHTHSTYNVHQYVYTLYIYNIYIYMSHVWSVCVCVFVSFLWQPLNWCVFSFGYWPLVAKIMLCWNGAKPSVRKV